MEINSLIVRQTVRLISGIHLFAAIHRPAFNLIK